MSDNADFNDFSITKEEIDSFEKALKNEEFRKLLVEYAEEISDPENRKKYEEEITQMEKMRGMDVKFVNPEDGYVVKTVDTKTGVKAFINICSNVHINRASSSFAEKEEHSGKKKAGYQWNIPYSLSPPRDDFDRAGAKCIVYDCVFHPDTYKMGQKDTRFRQLMIDTALDGIEREFKAHLNRKGLKFPKMKFKGIKRPTVIRNKSTEEPEKSHQDCTIGGMKFPYPNNNGLSNQHQEGAKEKEQKKVNGPIIPEYRIVHRGVIDFQNFTHARDSNTSTRPKELVVYIDLPRLESTASVDLDILEKQLILDCKQPSYHLDLALPYPVDEENGTAKFEKTKRQLTVTLTVLPPPPPPVPKMDQHPMDVVDTEDGLLQQDAEHQERSSTFQTTSAGLVESPLPTSTDQLTGLEPVIEDGSSRPEPLADLKDGFVIESNEQNFSMDEQAEPTITEELSTEPRDVALETETRLSAEEVLDMEFELSYASSGMSAPCFFRCPPYTYHQDKDTVTFIIDVPQVALDSVSLGFNDNKVYISFPSESPRPGERAAPDYALYIQFPVGQNVQEDLCNIDVSEDNLVLTLHKQDSCMELWDSFEAGSAEELLETKYFVTQKTVEKMMLEIAEQDPWAALKCEASVKVSSVTDDCLTIEAETDLEKPVGSELQGLHCLSAGRIVLGGQQMDKDSSSFNQVDVDSAENLQTTNLTNNGDAKELNGEVRENGLSKSINSEDGTRDSEARFAEKEDSFVPIELINNAVRARRSILRSSSTSTDDSYGDENEFSFTPESPSRKNVRFNLTPNVRVFSNKKDKKSRKLQARLKEESRKYSQDSEESGSDQSNGTSPVDNGADWNGFDCQSNGAAESEDSVSRDFGQTEELNSKIDNVYIDCSNGDIRKPSTAVSNAGSSAAFGLTNTLIFEIDD